MDTTWKALINQPKFNASTMLLLTDGSVICQEAGGKAWWRLAPDGNGSYVNGTWSAIAPMHHTRLYYASAVLKDGRVFVAGGEYSDAGSETNAAEIYDPLTDSWTEIAAPAGWARIGDAPCTVLPDGRVLVGQISDQRTAIYDPLANTWSEGAAKRDRSTEESWVLMLDGTIVTVQCSAHPGTEKYIIATNEWISVGNTPNDLVEAASLEVGAGILLPDSRAFFIGATPYIALYTPGANSSDVGSWVQGPAIPKDSNGKACGAKDAPACLMTNGHVLLTVGPVNDVSGHYLGPTYFYEYDGQDLVKVPDAPNAGQVPFTGRMLLLPTGEILYASGTRELYAYTPAAPFQDAWRPEILTLPENLIAGFTYTLSGRRLNGLSQAVGYGDDASAATNYPLVRLRATNGQVSYCRTFGHSTMAVGTGSAVHTTNFLIPSVLASGSYELTVVANGIASNGVSISVSKSVAPAEWEAGWRALIGSLADGPLWSIGTNGPVPIGPGGPKSRTDVRAARRSIVSGIRTLQRVGKQLQRTRLTAARSAEPAIDPELLKRPRLKPTSKRRKNQRSRVSAAVNSPAFWFTMQIAMLAGFITSYPVNWWLIKVGIKERM